ncbi:MAG TPA: hypothetical protein VH796_08560 [Nitrososphaeraceae archaeon]|jgi:two-component SAPR family response regulator
MPEMSGFSFYSEIKKLDETVKVCFLTAGEINYGKYSDDFPLITDNCIIQKPVTNEDLLKFINRAMYCDGKNY